MKANIGHTLTEPIPPRCGQVTGGRSFKKLWGHTCVIASFAGRWRSGGCATKREDGMEKPIRS